MFATLIFARLSRIGHLHELSPLGDVFGLFFFAPGPFRRPGNPGLPAGRKNTCIVELPMASSDWIFFIDGI